jgi:NADP-dependent aldehyde dehydrogenase
MLIQCQDESQMLEVAQQFHGSLTTTIHAEPTGQPSDDQPFVDAWLPIAERFAGRIIRNGWPTGMEIGPATQHGGPFPASLDGRSTSVGYASLERFIRPVCYQNWDD